MKDAKCHGCEYMQERKSQGATDHFCRNKEAPKYPWAFIRLKFAVGEEGAPEWCPLSVTPDKKKKESK